MKGSPTNKDLLGTRFDKLLVIKKLGKRGGSWLCRCDCGKTRKFYSSDLLNRHNTTCKCGTGKQNLRHGFAAGESEGRKRHRFYRIWDGLRKRIFKKDDPHYHIYGGRGIKSAWKNIDDFKRDMYESYLSHVEEFGEKNTTIDRIDNDGHYCKENCRWATIVEQGNNRRTCIYVDFNGEKLSISQYARKLGINRHSLYKHKDTLPLWR